MEDAGGGRNAERILESRRWRRERRRERICAASGRSFGALRMWSGRVAGVCWFGVWEEGGGRAGRAGRREEGEGGGRTGRRKVRDAGERGKERDGFSSSSRLDDENVTKAGEKASLRPTPYDRNGNGRHAGEGGGEGRARLTRPTRLLPSRTSTSGYRPTDHFSHSFLLRPSHSGSLNVPDAQINMGIVQYHDPDPDPELS